MGRILSFLAFVLAMRLHLSFGCPAACPKVSEKKLADGTVIEVCDCRKKPPPTPPRKAATGPVA
ncbi:MAG: hypothetical protein HY369_00600 [Candidatus Aenigmarchaeota archaeon]|nr:hypothetical protein [Candidatus Aenigmarchaeota archaeon]